MKQHVGQNLYLRRIIGTVHEQNAFLVADFWSHKAVVIDPGPGTFDRIHALIQDMSLELNYILLTHEHYDHMGDVELTRKFYPSCKVVASTASSECLQDPRRNLSAFHSGSSFSTGPADIQFDEDEMSLPWSGHAIRLNRTQGHSPGSICIAIAGVLFTGDTMIHGIRTVIKLPGGNRNGLIASLDWLFENHPPATRIQPGHGAPFFLSRP